MPTAAILFFRMRLISVPEKFTPMKISCKFGEPSWCSFSLRALTPKICTRCGGGVVNAKSKYPPDASCGYNYPLFETYCSKTNFFLKVMSEYFFAILVTKNWTGRPGFDSQCCGTRHHSSVTEHSVCYFVVAILQHKKIYIF